IRDAIRRLTARKSKLSEMIKQIQGEGVIVPLPELFQQQIVQFVIPKRAKIIHCKEMGVIKRAVSKLIEIFQYAVMSSAQSDKLPENRRVGRTPDSFFNLPRFGNAAIGNEHHVYRQGAVSKIINYLFHHRRFVIRTA